VTEPTHEPQADAVVKVARKRRTEHHPACDSQLGPDFPGWTVEQKSGLMTARADRDGVKVSAVVRGRRSRTTRRKDQP
jgi:hypothetical protein